MSEVTILWRRLDAEGHDCCRLLPAADGWRLEGAAAFLRDSQPACLRYHVACDAGWRTAGAAVSGWLGGKAVDLRIDRSAAGAWRLNGKEQPVPAGLVDLDLGFTPATNILPVRRLALPQGDEAEAPAAYLAFPEMRLELLEQTYRRLDARRYAYAAPRFGYEGILTVSETGFVTSYPRLFEMAGMSSG